MANWQSGDVLTITGGQLRAARAFLRWTAQEVADASRVGVATVRRAELQDGPLAITAANAEAIKRALEAAGVDFINGGEPGVKLRRKDHVSAGDP